MAGKLINFVAMKNGQLIQLDEIIEGQHIIPTPVPPVPPDPPVPPVPPYPPCEPMTLRFQFSKADYSPVDAGVGTSGTWVKRTELENENVWDWTNTNDVWKQCFHAAFIDDTNDVSIIASGDLSNVIDMDDMFSGNYENSPTGSSYNLIARNNIVYSCPLNIAPDATSMFLGSALATFPECDFSRAVNVQNMFADTYMEKVDCHNISGSFNLLTGFFAWNSRLTTVDIGITSSNPVVASVSGMFSRDMRLETIRISNLPNRIANFQSMFQTCEILTNIDCVIDLISATNVVGMFNGCKALKRIPTMLHLYESGLDNIQGMFNGCNSLEVAPELDTRNIAVFNRLYNGCRKLAALPEMSFVSATNVGMCFQNCFAAKTGIMEAYNQMVDRGSAITNHANAFTDCGRDTPEGQAALAQIPTSWGGLME